MQRVIAVDWSGDKSVAHKKIWVCAVSKGDVLRLENGRSREAVAEYLVAEAERDPRFVVGLDFAFSFPRRFLKKRAHRKIESVWEEAERLGENWLSHCPFPFWGKPGSKKPGLGELLYRQTEIEVGREQLRMPFSVFQTGGAGAVGVGSIRGMPILQRLRQAGFSIWPFHEPELPMVVEIWPRVFMGELKKRNESARTHFLRGELPTISGEFQEAARKSDDALDALVSAVAMDRHRKELGKLRKAEDRKTLLEGAIWCPAVP